MARRIGVLGAAGAGGRRAAHLRRHRPDRWPAVDLQEAGDHGPAVLLEVAVPDGVCPDDGAECLPHRLDDEQFGVVVPDRAAEPGHEGAVSLGVAGELLVLQPDQVADPGTVQAAPEVDDADPPVVDDPVAGWLR